MLDPSPLPLKVELDITTVLLPQCDEDRLQVAVDVSKSQELSNSSLVAAGAAGKLMLCPCRGDTISRILGMCVPTCTVFLELLQIYAGVDRTDVEQQCALASVTLRVNQSSH